VLGGEGIGVGAAGNITIEGGAGPIEGGGGGLIAKLDIEVEAEGAGA
jgi:hypothetical protein